jgi:hypothetical protein
MLKRWKCAMLLQSEQGSFRAHVDMIPRSLRVVMERHVTSIGHGRTWKIVGMEAPEVA